MSAEDDRAAGASDPNERRDAALKQAWVDASRETSPPHVDARILAAARAAVAQERRRDDAPRGRTRWNVVQRWQPALAAAAVAGLAFVLVPLTMSPPPAERATAPVTTDAAAPTDSGKTYETPTASPRAREDAGGSPASASQRPAPSKSPAPPERAIGSGRPSPATGDAQPSTPAAVPPPPRAGEATFDLAVPADDARTEEPASAASGAPGSPGQLGSVATRPRSEAAAESSRASEGAAAAPPVSQAREKRDEDATTVDARALAARVEDLYRAGEIAAAAQELRAFRAVEPGADGYLPEELRDWARTVD